MAAFVEFLDLTGHRVRVRKADVVATRARSTDKDVHTAIFLRGGHTFTVQASLDGVEQNLAE